MANNLDLATWEERWQALDKIMEDLTRQYGALSSPVPRPVPRRDTLVQLVKRSRAFAKEQFHFFHNGFNPAVGGQKLEESADFPPDYVFRMTLDQISYDLEVIQRAADIRMSDSSPKDMLDTLNRADQLAWEYIEAAKGLGLIVEDETTVLTYFQKSPSIRIIPYAPVALVGIPYTAISAKQDFLVTPHEIGHYVYWHGTVPNKKPPEPICRYLKVAGIDDWAKRWTEEIFADVYACQYGGPATALSSQDLALQNRREKFIEDDGEHPVPALRPFTYINVLSKDPQTEQLAKDLRGRWNGHLEGRKVKLSNRWKPKDDEEICFCCWRWLARPIALLVFGLKPHQQPEQLLSQTIKTETKTEGESEMEKPMDKVISKALEVLKPPPSSVSGGRSQIESLYSDFKNEVGRFPSSSPVEELGATDLANLWNNWVKGEKFFPQSSNGLPPSDKPIKAGKEDDLKNAPNGTWIHVLFAAGWTTKIGNHSGGG
jgi:hypothetical protein